MDEVVCYLSQKQKWRNKQEYHTIPQITCPEFNLEFLGHGLLETLMAKALYENNCDSDRVLAIYRGDTLVYTKVPLKRWIFKEDRRPDWLKGKVKGVGDGQHFETTARRER